MYSALLLDDISREIELIISFQNSTSTAIISYFLNR